MAWTCVLPIMPLHTDPEVIVFNLKRRFSGVSATINALVPLQMQQWRLGFCGTTLSNGVPGMRLRDALRLSRRPPAGRPFRIWHVRRDPEMMVGIFARDVLGLPIRLVFTSAAQYRHGHFPRWLISRMDAVIATTDKAASFVPNTTAMVAHGIDLSRFFAPVDKGRVTVGCGSPETIAVGNFGRVRPEKGSDVFVDAMIKVLPTMPGVSAFLAGLAQPQHQAFQAELQQRIEAAGLNDRIRFVGEIPAGEISRWYQRCLVVVACPRYEAFGLTPFEAAACGCALVCSRTGAFEQLVQPGINGALVDIGDANGLAQALRDVLADPARAHAMGAAARERVAEHFSLQRESDGIGQVYRKLFERG
jgi:mannosyltransferase